MAPDRFRFDLVLALTRRDLAVRYRGSMLGVGWSLITPLMMLAIFAFVFGSVFQSRWGTSAAPPGVFALVLFPGLLMHGFLADCLTRAPGLITANPGYVRKIIFPVEVLGIVAVLSALVQLAIGLAVLLAFQLYFEGSLRPEVLWLPLILLPLAAMALGLTWLLAALGAYLRDLGQAMGPVMLALMFASPVVYPVDALPPEWRGIAYWSPLTWPIEAIRAAVFSGAAPDASGFAGYGACALAVAVVGGLAFRHLRQGFADVL